jgi:DNA-3-methyladenine glycosylase II
VTRKAVRHLRTVDPVFAALIDRVGPCRLELRDSGTHFGYVVRCIVGQQLSGKAAATIHGRVMALYGDRSPLPGELLKTTDSALRVAGLSGRKVEYVKELAQRTHRGELAVERLHEMDDETVLATLTSVRGIGRWTAQMVLLFRLGRPDIFPELDLSIQKAVQQLLRMRQPPTQKQLIKISERWSPYRSVATWYLYRSLEVDG